MIYYIYIYICNRLQHLGCSMESISLSHPKNSDTARMGHEQSLHYAQVIDLCLIARLLCLINADIMYMCTKFATGIYKAVKSCQKTHPCNRLTAAAATINRVHVGLYSHVEQGRSCHLC